jgi:hypothetical protein
VLELEAYRVYTNNLDRMADEVPVKMTEAWGLERR